MSEELEERRAGTFLISFEALLHPMLFQKEE
jgi:hypothetical protein